MELILGIISGFLLGFIVSHIICLRKVKAHDGTTDDFNLYSTRVVEPELAGIIHPIPPMVKRENQIIQEAKERGEDSVPLDEL